MFILHPKLQEDTHFLADLPLSCLLLMNDNRFPWLILVPRLAGNITELFHLEPATQLQFWQEINTVTAWAHQYFAADKMNVANLGNIVPQLHVHIIARKQEDACWPKPVWGMGEKVPYEKNKVEELRNAVTSFLVNGTALHKSHNSAA